MKNSIITFFASVPKIIKLFILAFIFSLAIDNLFPYSTDFSMEVIKAAIFAILMILLDFMFLKDEYRKAIRNER